MLLSSSSHHPQGIGGVAADADLRASEDASLVASLGPTLDGGVQTPAESIGKPRSVPFKGAQFQFTCVAPRGTSERRDIVGWTSDGSQPRFKSGPSCPAHFSKTLLWNIGYLPQTSAEPEQPRHPPGQQPRQPRHLPHHLQHLQLVGFSGSSSLSFKSGSASGRRLSSGGGGGSVKEWGFSGGTGSSGLGGSFKERILSKDSLSGSFKERLLSKEAASRSFTERGPHQERRPAAATLKERGLSSGTIGGSLKERAGNAGPPGRSQMDRVLAKGGLGGSLQERATCTDHTDAPPEDSGIKRRQRNNNNNINNTTEPAPIQGPKHFGVEGSAHEQKRGKDKAQSGPLSPARTAAVESTSTSRGALNDHRTSQAKLKAGPAWARQQTRAAMVSLPSLSHLIESPGASSPELSSPGTPLGDPGLEAPGCPIETIEIGSRTAAPGETYPVRPLAAIKALDGSGKASWRVIAVAVEDPLGGVLVRVFRACAKPASLADVLKDVLREMQMLYPEYTIPDGASVAGGLLGTAAAADLVSAGLSLWAEFATSKDDMNLHGDRVSAGRKTTVTKVRESETNANADSGSAPHIVGTEQGRAHNLPGGDEGDGGMVSEDVVEGVALPRGPAESLRPALEPLASVSTSARRQLTEKPQGDEHAKGPGGGLKRWSSWTQKGLRYGLRSSATTEEHSATQESPAVYEPDFMKIKPFPSKLRPAGQPSAHRQMQWEGDNVKRGEGEGSKDSAVPRRIHRAQSLPVGDLSDVQHEPSPMARTGQGRSQSRLVVAFPSLREGMMGAGRGTFDPPAGDDPGGLEKGGETHMGLRHGAGVEGANRGPVEANPVDFLSHAPGKKASGKKKLGRNSRTAQESIAEGKEHGFDRSGGMAAKQEKSASVGGKQDQPGGIGGKLGSRAVQSGRGLFRMSSWGVGDLEHVASGIAKQHQHGARLSGLRRMRSWGVEDLEEGVDGSRDTSSNGSGVLGGAGEAKADVQQGVCGASEHRSQSTRVLGGTGEKKADVEEGVCDTSEKSSRGTQGLGRSSERTVDEARAWGEQVECRKSFSDKEREMRGAEKEALRKEKEPRRSIERTKGWGVAEPEGGMHKAYKGKLCVEKGKNSERRKSLQGGDLESGDMHGTERRRRSLEGGPPGEGLERKRSWGIRELERLAHGASKSRGHGQDFGLTKRNSIDRQSSWSPGDLQKAAAEEGGHSGRAGAALAVDRGQGEMVAGRRSRKGGRANPPGALLSNAAMPLAIPATMPATMPSTGVGPKSHDETGAGESAKIGAGKRALDGVPEAFLQDDTHIVACFETGPGAKRGLFRTSSMSGIVQKVLSTASQAFRLPSRLAGDRTKGRSFEGALGALSPSAPVLCMESITESIPSTSAALLQTDDPLSRELGPAVRRKK